MFDYYAPWKLVVGRRFRPIFRGDFLEGEPFLALVNQRTSVKHRHNPPRTPKNVDPSPELFRFQICFFLEGFLLCETSRGVWKNRPLTIVWRTKKNPKTSLLIHYCFSELEWYWYLDTFWKGLGKLLSSTDRFDRTNQQQNTSSRALLASTSAMIFADSSKNKPPQGLCLAT